MVINIHITPRERERLIREERQRRRVARILQVRQQADENARLIRQNLQNQKKNKVEEMRKELRRSVSEVMYEGGSVSEEQRDGVQLPLPLDSSFVPSNTRRRSSTRTPRRHRHIFTKEDAIRALERGRQTQERLHADRVAEKRKAAEAIRLKRQAQNEANRFNRANPTTR